ncbi:hypothetical protein J6590_092328 [Homalodisca vitripennis]|nr:hypothetical protein J6590_092328 [Homalodisca vitripennis]
MHVNTWAIPYTLRFLSANKSLFPLHLKHLLYSPPIRKQPASTYLFYPDLCPHPSGYPGFRLPLYVSYPRVLLISFGCRLQVVGVVLYILPLIIPVSFDFRLRPLRHLTLPCAADETSRYLIAFRVFPHKPDPLLNTPTCPPNSYLPYVLQRRFIQKQQRRIFKQVGTGRPYNPTERCCRHRCWQQTDNIRGSAHAPTWLLYKGADHQHSSHSFLGDHRRKISETDNASPLSEKSKRNLSSCAREIRAPLSPRPLEQSKRKLSPCAREIPAPLRLSPLERSKRNLSPCAREIPAPLSSRPLEQSKRNLSPCAREIQLLSSPSSLPVPNLRGGGAFLVLVHNFLFLASLLLLIWLLVRR